MEDAKLLSDIIQWLRVPLTILVIFVHTNVELFEDKSSMAFSSCYDYITDIVGFVASFAVPAFFVISGYLFFRNIEVLRFSIIVRKFKSRFNSLVIPFLFWNLLVYVWALLSNIYVNGDATSVFSFLNKYSLYNIFISIQGYGTPIYMIMWYVRDLIVLTILSPLIYYAIKYFKVFFVLFVLFLYVFHGGCLRWLGYLSVAFFTLGAYVGIKKINVLALFSRKWVMATYSFFLLICFIFYPFEILPAECDRLIRVFGVVCVFYLAYLFVKSGAKSYRLASSASFFIYCTHVLQPANKLTILAFSTFVLSNTIGTIPYIGSLLAYILCPICTYMICLTLYVLLLRLFPRFVSIISGSR